MRLKRFGLLLIGLQHYGPEFPHQERTSVQSESFLPEKDRSRQGQFNECPDHQKNGP
jgi:hypothetical protein